MSSCSWMSDGCKAQVRLMLAQGRAWPCVAVPPVPSEQKCGFATVSISRLWPPLQPVIQ